MEVLREMLSVLITSDVYVCYRIRQKCSWLRIWNRQSNIIRINKAVDDPISVITVWIVVFWFTTVVYRGWTWAVCYKLAHLSTLRALVTDFTAVVCTNPPEGNLASRCHCDTIASDPNGTWNVVETGTDKARCLFEFAVMCGRSSNHLAIPFAAISLVTNIHSN